MYKFIFVKNKDLMSNEDDDVVPVRMSACPIKRNCNGYNCDTCKRWWISYLAVINEVECSEVQETQFKNTLHIINNCIDIPWSYSKMG